MPRPWFKSIVASLALVAGGIAQQATADDVTLVSGDAAVNQRLANLEAEVERLRAASATTFAAHHTFDEPAVPPVEGCDTPAPCGPTIGADFFNCGQRCGGVVGGTEVIFFKPFYTGGGAPNIDPAVSGGGTFVNYPTLQYNYTGAPRVWLGYVGANGLGGRARFFDFYQTGTTDISTQASAPLGTFLINGMVATRTYDLELTQQASFRHWTLQGFGGLRYAQANQQMSYVAGALTGQQMSISYYGLGPTAGLQIDRALTSNQRWSFYGAARGSLLYGNQRDNVSDITGNYVNANRINNSTFASIWELSLGPQWKIRLPRGGDFFVRSTVEAQFWQGVGNFAPIGANAGGFPLVNRNDDAGGFGLLGFSTAVGITR